MLVRLGEGGSQCVMVILEEGGTQCVGEIGGRG